MATPAQSNKSPIVVTAMLRSLIAPSANTVVVDFDGGVIRNCAVMTIGPASGHGFDIDDVALRQTFDLMLAAEPEGLAMRFKHPRQDESGQLDDALGSNVGVIKNPRLDASSIRADVYLGQYAKHLPGFDAWTYLLHLANERPQDLGLSTVIRYTTEELLDANDRPVQVVARVAQLLHVDFVGKPAANPNGLMSAKTNKQVTNGPTGTLPGGASRVPPRGVQNMHATMKTLLAGAGCNPSASIEDARKFYDSLEEGRRTELDGSFKALAGDGVDAWAEEAAPVTPEPGGADLSAILTGIQRDLAQLKQGSQARPMPKPGVAVPLTKPAVDDDTALLRAEEKRTSDIRQLGKVYGIEDAEVGRVVALGQNMATARTEFLKHLQTKNPATPSISVGDNLALTSLREAIPNAIMARNGYDFADAEKRDVANKVTNPRRLNDRARALAQKPLLGMFAEYLVAYGAPMEKVYAMTTSQLADLLGPRKLRQTFGNVAQLAESTSDFPSLLLDAMNKSMRYSYLDAPRQWQKFAARNTAPDFKNINRIAMSEAPNMVSRDEGKETVYQIVVDSKESYTLKEFTNGIILTRRVIINDDMNAFQTIPQKFSASAARLEDDLAFGVFTTNPVMADGNNLFSTAHLNLVTNGNGGPPTIPQMSLMQTLMAKQKGLNGTARLDLQPAFLIVPQALWATTYAFINSTQQIPTISTNSAGPLSQGNVNPYAGRYEVITSTRLDDASPTAWYAVADYRTGQVNTLEMCFLAGEPEPVMKQETDFDTDDVKYAMRHTIAVKAIDHRGFAMDYGA